MQLDVLEFIHYIQSNDIRRIVYFSKSNYMIADTVVVSRVAGYGLIYLIDAKAPDHYVLFGGVTNIAIDRKASGLNANGERYGWDVVKFTCERAGRKPATYIILIDYRGKEQ